jgi:hypothetical protein
MHMTDGVTVSSLSASLQHKTSTAIDRACQIMFNRTLSRKFKKWCKFLSPIKAKLGKKKLHKERPTCILYFIIGMTAAHSWVEKLPKLKCSMKAMDDCIVGEGAPAFTVPKSLCCSYNANFKSVVSKHAGETSNCATAWEFPVVD